MDITTVVAAGHFSSGNQDNKNNSSYSDSVSNSKGQWYMSYDSKDVLQLWGKPTDLAPRPSLALAAISEKEDTTSKVLMDIIFANKCTIESIVNIPTKLQLLSLAHKHGIGVQPSLQIHLQPVLCVAALVKEYRYGIFHDL
jgi:hypothetical protein